MENVKGISEAWELVKFSLKKAQNYQKEFADLNRNAREHDFKLFDLIMTHIDHWPGEEYHKFRAKWSGPWRIIEIKGPVLKIKNLQNPENILKIHKDKAKKFIQYSVVPLKMPKGEKLINSNSENLDVESELLERPE